MDHNLTSLTKGWIQFLKNNQIVRTQSDPKTGRLKYKRPTTVSDVTRYLKLNTDFDDETISSALKSVLSTQQPSNDVSTWKHDEMTPGQRPAEPDPRVGAPKVKKYSTDDAEDVDYRDGKTPSKQPRPALPNKKAPLAEDFYDNQGAELDEKQVKKLFSILVTPAAKEVPPEESPPEEAPKTDADMKADKQAFFRKLKELVRDVMTPEQRRTLHRALSADSLSESVISNTDINAIFKDAAYLRSKPSLAGKVFKRFRKDKIDVEDLRKAWAEGSEPDGSDGYSDDTRDIKRILQQFGFADKEISKVFANVFGGDNDNQSAEQTETVRKIAALAIEKGLGPALKSFLEQEYAEELKTGKKVTHEDIKHIFTAMVQEDRNSRNTLIKEEDRLKLGRTKK